MPCCFAILTYAQCLHHTLFKIGCTAGCNDLCAPEKREILLKCRYLWCCEECHERIHDAADEERQDNWSVQIMRLCQEQGTNALTETRIENMRRKEEFKERRRERAMMSRVEEIQWVCDWTTEYGLVLYKMAYGRPLEEGKAEERIKQLLDLRLWDFIVAHEPLRGAGKLLKQQSHHAFWTTHRMSTIVASTIPPLLTCYIGNMMNRHRMRKTFRRRLRHLPPPPLFDAGEATTQEDEWSHAWGMDPDEEEQKAMEGLEKAIPRSMIDVGLQTESTTTLNQDEVEGAQGEDVERQHDTIDGIE